MTFKDLDAWKYARLLVKEIYELSKHFPDDEKFGLTNQIRRAAVSIPSNIAEGYGRKHKKEVIQFLSIANASINEVETQLILAEDLNYINQILTIRTNENLIDLRKTLNGYIKYIENRKT
ncbi:MAG: four helix bundle protein [Bacteroidetes bacterium]|nr:four helix bundle protein [Bacteroidota bacterium]